MVSTVYFLQNCPICGRPAEIRVSYLGRQVTCSHCRGEFLARDPASQEADLPTLGNELLRRADELLRIAPGLTRRKAAVGPATWVGL